MEVILIGDASCNCFDDSLGSVTFISHDVGRRVGPLSFVFISKAMLNAI